MGTLTDTRPSTSGMDVYLIPTATEDRYELYYEAPEVDPEEDTPGRGLHQRVYRRVRRRFSDMIREAEEWRHGNHEHEEPVKAGLLTRARRRVMSFVVERIAEQRLLWHLRSATDVCAQIPADLPEAEADAIVRGLLKKDFDHHFKWIWIDLALLILVAPLVLVPGPNVPGFYFTFQVVGHFLSYRGARHGLTEVQWSLSPNPALAELRALLVETTPQRTRRLHELAARLRLQHLANFFEQVATPTA